MKKPCLLISLTLLVVFTTPSYAIFDNSCLIFNIASRDNAMADTWLSDSLFYLSAKKKTAARLRNLTYDDATEAKDKKAEGKILGEEDVSFAPNGTQATEATTAE